jgi:hypothetical protein
MEAVSDAVGMSGGPVAQVNFINHFSGCQLCTQQNKDGDYAQCESEFVKSFEYADGIYSKLLKRMPPRDIAHEQQLAATPYCKVGGPPLLRLPSLTLLLMLENTVRTLPQCSPAQIYRCGEFMLVSCCRRIHARRSAGWQ